jgi:hypothetical protein
LLIIAINFFAFLPKAVNKLKDESGRSSGLCLTSDTFPSAVADSGFEEWRSFESALTATGIAPELHRTSLLMTTTRQPNSA